MKLEVADNSSCISTFQFPSQFVGACVARLIAVFTLCNHATIDLEINVWLLREYIHVCHVEVHFDEQHVFISTCQFVGVCVAVLIAVFTLCNHAIID